MSVPGLTAGGTSIVCEGLVSLRHTWPALSKGYASRAGTTPGISYVLYISLQELKDYALSSETYCGQAKDTHSTHNTCSK